jgi:hypothetical protein
MGFFWIFGQGVGYFGLLDKSFQGRRRFLAFVSNSVEEKSGDIHKNVLMLKETLLWKLALDEQRNCG